MKGRFNFSELYRTLIFMAWRFNFMKQYFNVEKTQKYRGKIFRTRHFSKEGGTPYGKIEKIG